MRFLFGCVLSVCVVLPATSFTQDAEVIEEQLATGEALDTAEASESSDDAGEELTEAQALAAKQEALDAETPLFADAVETSTTTAPSSTSISVPYDIKGGGAFVSSVPIELPEYAGIVPNLALTYNSQGHMRSGDGAFLGDGWSLSGLPSIERKSVGGGVPFYDMNYDVFMYNGSELLACNDATATNVYTETAYPEDYKSTNTSASCLAGGNMTTQFESFQKIVRTGSDTDTTTSFTITHKDGTQYLFETIAAAVGWTGSNDYNTDRFRRKWVLTTITDTQPNPRTVEIKYYVAGGDKGFAIRPGSIKYADYKVQFAYEANDFATASYGVGTDTFTTQDKTLRGIMVLNHSTLIKAYHLDYIRRETTGAHLLTKVTPYGSDYTQTDGEVTAGTALPSWEYAYQDEATRVDYNRVTANTDESNNLVRDRKTSTSDVDINGRAEHYALGRVYQSGSDNDTTYNCLTSAPVGQI